MGRITPFLILALLMLGSCTSGLEGDDPGECSDGADNDRDLMFDCDDPDCAASPVCDGVVDDDDDDDDDDVSDDDDSGGPSDDDDVSDDDDTGPDDDDDTTPEPGDIIVAEEVVQVEDDECFAGATVEEGLGNVEIDFSCEPTYGSFEAGDILVGVDGGGYMVWVDEVEQVGDTWIATTHPAGLLDLIDDGTWEIFLEDMLEERASWTFNPTISSGPITAGVDISVTLNPDITLNGDVSILPPSLNSFYATVGGSLNASVEATITATASTGEISGTQDLLSAPVVGVKAFSIGPISLQAGLFADLDLNYELEATAAAGMSVGWQTNGTFEFGVQYGSGGWSGVNTQNFTSSTIGPSFTTVGGVVQARLGLEISLIIKVLSVDGPYVGFEPYMEGCAHLNALVPEVNWEYEYGLELEAGIELEMLGGLIDIDESVDFPGFPMVLGSDSGTWTP